MKFSSAKEETWVGKLSSEVNKFLKSQSKVIIADIKRLLNQFYKDDDTNEIRAGMIAVSYLSSNWETDLTEVMSPILGNVYKDSVDEAVQSLSVEISGAFSGDATLHSFANKYASERTAELVTGLDDTTRNMLKNELIDCMNEGMTIQEISNQLQDSYAFSENRALKIGRTETGFAWNHGTVSMYKNVEGATGVLVHDGDHDNACREVEGQAWGFDYAMKHLLEHPNCVRSFSIYFGELDVE
jgi:hypothetical protein